MILASQIARGLLKKYPKCVIETEIDEKTNTVHVVIWNADETRVLKKFTLDTIAQSNLVAKLGPSFIEAFL